MAPQPLPISLRRYAHAFTMQAYGHAPVVYAEHSALCLGSCPACDASRGHIASLAHRLATVHLLAMTAKLSARRAA